MSSVFSGERKLNSIKAIFTNLIDHFRVPPGPLFQNEGRCSAFDMEIIFHSHANKTHFHKKGCAPSLILKVRVFGTRKWPIALTVVPPGVHASIIASSQGPLLQENPGTKVGVHALSKKISFM